MDQTQARLAAIRQTLENDVELRQALAAHESAEQGRLRAERQLAEAEQVVQAQQIKIEQAESSLYGGHVHNPKELQDLQSDVASLKRHLAVLEERQLESMLEVDAAQAAAQAAQTALQALQSRRGDDHKLLIEEQGTLVRNIERLQSERRATVSDLAGAALEMYQGLRERKKGVAVVEVADNCCSACGTALNAALQQSARSANQLSYCPSCGRILYAS